MIFGLAAFDRIKRLVVLGYAGRGTFLTQQEHVKTIKAFIQSVGHRILMITGIIDRGADLAAEEVKRAREAGAAAGQLPKLCDRTLLVQDFSQWLTNPRDAHICFYRVSTCLYGIRCSVFAFQVACPTTK